MFDSRGRACASCGSPGIITSGISSIVHRACTQGKKHEVCLGSDKAHGNYSTTLRSITRPKTRSWNRSIFTLKLSRLHHFKLSLIEVRTSTPPTQLFISIATSEREFTKSNTLVVHSQEPELNRTLMHAYARVCTCMHDYVRVCTSIHAYARRCTLMHAYEATIANGGDVTFGLTVRSTLIAAFFVCCSQGLS